MREDEADVLGMLVRHEAAIKELYEIFAAMFTDRGEFWQRFARDEERHAGWLERLRSESAIEQWLLHGSGLKLQAIKTSIGYVESQIKRAKQGNLSLIQALSIARDLESALLERQFSKLIDSAPEKIMPVVTRLADETKRHLEIVVEAIHSEKR